MTHFIQTPVHIGEVLAGNAKRSGPRIQRKRAFWSPLPAEISSSFEPIFLSHAAVDVKLMKGFLQERAAVENALRQGIRPTPFKMDSFRTYRKGQA
jgi:hypothetical protein